MISNRVRGLNLLHWAMQAVMVVALFWAWVFFFSNTVRGGEAAPANDRYFIYSLVVGAAFLVDLWRSKLAQGNLLHLDVVRSHGIALRQTCIVIGALLVFLVAQKDIAISRLFLFTFAPLLYCALVVSNKFFPPFLARFVFSYHPATTVLLGTRDHARKLSSWLERKASYGFRTVGLITDDAAPREGDTLPVLGSFGEMERIVKETRPSQLIMLDLPMSPEQIVALGNLCDKLGVRLFIVNDLEDKLHRSVLFLEDDGFHFLAFRQEPLECPIGRMMKRCFDIAIALPVVVFVLPLTSLAVWLCHRVQSPGPLFFTQRRTGKYNQEFQILKYRTMHVDHGDEARQATADDCRVFRTGRWLRKLSIDELPQFVNVLRGEMSVVGPRPHFVDHDELFGEIANFYRVRSFIKPGITGLAQVRGLRGEARRDQDLIDRIHSDLYYLENWSLLLDGVIIVRTAWHVVFPPKSAY
jgi:exopolysaccharide biosynthesis polyprenyl glycosylphosphotransferase